MDRKSIKSEPEDDNDPLGAVDSLEDEAKAVPEIPLELIENIKQEEIVQDSQYVDIGVYVLDEIKQQVKKEIVEEENHFKPKIEFEHNSSEQILSDKNSLQTEIRVVPTTTVLCTNDPTASHLQQSDNALQWGNSYEGKVCSLTEFELRMFQQKAKATNLPFLVKDIIKMSPQDYNNVSNVSLDHSQMSLCNDIRKALKETDFAKQNKYIYHKQLLKRKEGPVYNDILVKKPKSSTETKRCPEVSPPNITSTSSPGLSTSKWQRTKNLTKEQRTEIVNECVQDKVSPVDLAKKWNCNPDTIRTWVRKAGKNLPRVYKSHYSFLNQL